MPYQHPPHSRQAQPSGSFSTELQHSQHGTQPGVLILHLVAFSSGKHDSCIL